VSTRSSAASRSPGGDPPAVEVPPHLRSLPLSERSLFQLPLPEIAEGKLHFSEPTQLRHGVWDGRGRAKYHFWRPLDRLQDLCPDRVPRPRARDPIPPERLEQLEKAFPERHDQRFREQPLPVSDALREKTPQFILRNLPRYEKDAWVNDLFWERKLLRDLLHDVGLEDVRTLRCFEKFEFQTTFGIDVIRLWRGEHREWSKGTAWAELNFKGGRLLEGSKRKLEEEAIASGKIRA